MTGVQKAALVLMNLSTDRAAEVLRQFTEQEAEEIAAEIVRLSSVDAKATDAVLIEFQKRTVTPANGPAKGGRDVAHGLLEAALGSEKATGLLDRVTNNGNQFEFLQGAESQQIATLLDGELPETVAMVLAHLQPDHASAALARFDGALQADVAQCLATMGSATPDAVRTVAETLRHRSRAFVQPREKTEVVGGVLPLVNIINRSDAATERALLAALDERDPALAEEVRSRMLTFADLLRFDARDVQQVLRGVDPAVLAIAMKNASDELSDTIRTNMSERNREVLDDEIRNLGPVRKADLEEAQSQVVRAIRELEAEGVIALARQTEEEEYVE